MSLHCMIGWLISTENKYYQYQLDNDCLHELTNTFRFYTNFYFWLTELNYKSKNLTKPLCIPAIIAQLPTDGAEL
jgi:hypothetical protein